MQYTLMRRHVHLHWMSITHAIIGYEASTTNKATGGGGGGWVLSEATGIIPIANQCGNNVQVCMRLCINQRLIIPFFNK